MVRDRHHARLKPSRYDPLNPSLHDVPANASRDKFLILLVLLAVPRIARMLYPQVWIEDESYLNGAFLLSRGFAPYRDFALPHFPLLEATLAGVFALAPAAIRTAEALTAVIGFAGSVLVFLVGARIADRRTGTVAALVFATSSLLFRYHLFEREVFDIVPVLAAAWLVASRRANTAGRCAAAGLLLAVAMMIKLTAVAALVAVVLDLALDRRRREAAIVGAIALGAIAAATIALALGFGSDFLVQVVAFRAVHASFPSFGVKLDEMRYTLDVAFALGAAGIAYVVWTRRTRQFRAPLLQLLSGAVFLVLLNPTYWAHTGIELLPWLAMFGGALVAGLKPRTTPAWACAGLAVLLVAFVSPIRNLNWQAGDGSMYGFGYRDRAEIEAAAAFVRAHTSDTDLVATPPIIAFAANRREVVPYAELAGDIADLADAVHRDGYLRAVASSPLRARGFWEGVEASRERTARVIDEAVRGRRAGAVINYSDADLFPIPLVDVDQPTLEGAGYNLESLTPHYEIWVKKATAGGNRQ